MNILTFNLRVDIAQDGRNAWCHRNHKAAEIIKKHQPAVFGTQLGEAPGRTFHGFAGGIEGEPIDYIFTTQDVVINGITIDRSTAEEGYPSDHYPVVAAVENIALPPID